LGVTKEVRVVLIHASALRADKVTV